MRSRSVVPAVALLTLSVAAPLAAQGPRPVQLGIGVGLSLLTGEDRDFFSDGFNAAGSVTVSVPAARIGLAEVMYQAMRARVSRDGRRRVLSRAVIAHVQRSSDLTPSRPRTIA